MKTLEDDEINKLFEIFRSRMINQRIEFKSVQFYKRQFDFIHYANNMLDMFGCKPLRLIGVEGVKFEICKPYKMYKI